MMGFTRRDFFKASIAGISALSFSWIGKQAIAKEKESLRIGYLPITDATPLLIAHAKGFYQEEGLTVEEPVRIRTWSALAESFLTNKFNVVHLLLPIPIWMRYNNQSPVKIVAWDHTNGSAITVRSDSGITEFEHLGGKQIAVPYWYSMHNVILQMGIRKAGLKPVIQPQSVPLSKSEVNLFVLPPPEMPVALAGNKIDGYIVAEPFNAFSEKRIGAKILRFTGDIWKDHPCCVIVMHESLIKSNPVFTQKVVNAIVRAQLWILNHLDETAKILSREGKQYLPVSEDILLRVFKGYENEIYGKGAVPQAIRHPEWNTRRIGFQPYPYPSATRFILNQMKETLVEGNSDFLKRLDPDIAVKDLVDDTFVKKAIDSVGGAKMFELIRSDSPWDRTEIIDI